MAVDSRRCNNAEFQVYSIPQGLVWVFYQKPLLLYTKNKQITLSKTTYADQLQAQSAVAAM